MNRAVPRVVTRAGAAAAVLAAGAAVAAAVRPVTRLAVAGASMEPTLSPGDRVLVRLRPRRRPRPGDVVAVRDPRHPERVMVKRVAGVSAAGVDVRGDNPSASTDSRQFGAVPPALVLGAVVYRYHPAQRAGRLPPAPPVPGRAPSGR